MPVECSRCNTDAHIDTADDGNLTCFKCGNIVEETDNLRAELDLVTSESGTRACGGLVSATSTGTSVATSLPRSLYRSRPTAYLAHGASNSVQKSIEKIASMLRIEKPVVEQMQYLYNYICDKGKYCRNPDRLAASIVYIVLRQNKKAYTMLDIAVTLQMNVFSLGKVYSKVLSANNDFIKLNDIEPTLFLEKACMQSEWPEQQKNTIKLLAMRIINALKGYSLETGRRHDAVFAAALHIAGEALSIPVDISKTCTALKVGDATLKARIKEMKEALLTAAKTIPWTKGMQAKVVHKHLLKILDTLEKLSDLMKKKNGSPQQTPSSSPPQTTNDPSAPPSPPTNNLLCDSTSSIPNPTSDAVVIYEPTLVPSVPTPQVKSEGEDKKTVTDFFALPPSFKVNAIARERRIRKLNDAKLRLLVSLHKDPGMFAALPQLKLLLESTQIALSNLPPIPSIAFPTPATPESFPVAPEFKPPSPSAYSPQLSPPSTPPPPFSASTPPSPVDNPIMPKRGRAPKAKAPVKPKRQPKKEEKKVDVFSTLLPNLDQEDLLIEKLLLNGADERSIIDGYYDAELSKTNSTHHHNLESEGVGELDIPDSEMHKFIRSAQEVEVLAQLSDSDSGEPAKKPKVTKRKERSGESGSSTRKRTRAPKTATNSTAGNSNSSGGNNGTSGSELEDDELRELSKLPASSLSF